MAKRYKQYLQRYSTRDEALSNGFPFWSAKLKKTGMNKMGYTIGYEQYQGGHWVVQFGPKP
jgi:hypothetical protein